MDQPQEQLNKNIQPLETPASGSMAESTAPSVAKNKKIVLSKKTIIIAIVVIIILALGGLVYRSRGFFVAATVNNSPISRLSVIKELEKNSGKNTLEALINQKLVNAEALKQDITVSTEEIATEIKTISDQLSAQGQELTAVLKNEGMTQADLEKQISTQKKLEKLLADKTGVSDEEVAEYLKNSGLQIPEGQEESYRFQAKEQLRQQKLNTAAGEYITSLRATAKINYFVEY
ncbi:MAG TPA: SurA N-terminal domain-containing protein [bacterium]|nr:SurA N-terminal domain-containing protein [bacterium]